MRLLSALASAFTITFGAITLLGLLLGDTLGLGADAALRDGVDILLQLTTVTLALAVLIGVGNLIGVHLRRVIQRDQGLVYSAALLLSFAAAVSLTLISRNDGLVLLETVQLSVESALAGVLFFALVYGAYRMMRHRVSWSAALFLLVLLIVLIAALPLSGTDAVRDLRDWLLEIPVSAGARGLLLGIALATVVTGVRVLIGVDRSYRE